MPAERQEKACERNALPRKEGINEEGDLGKREVDIYHSYTT